MNYSIIKDEDALNEFVEWLPELTENEKFYMCLFARRKYVEDFKVNIKSDKQQLKRVLTTKDMFTQKLRQMECAHGSYQAKGVAVPEQALAAYVNVNQRCMQKALSLQAKKCVDMLIGKAQGFNIAQEAMSAVQKSASDARPYIVFDFDWKDDTKIHDLIEAVDGYCDVIETRGGYHMFVHRSKTSEIALPKWYPFLSQFSDQQGDLMTPVVGCGQGGFVPRFYHRYEYS